MEPSSYILLVEDKIDIRESTRVLLEAVGYRVACAANGRDALDYLRHADPPAVILLDLSMPVMDGWQFRARQRRDPRLAAVPVLLLSGEADLPEIAASLGVAGHFPKPVEVSRLLETLRLLCKNRQPAGVGREWWRPILRAGVQAEIAVATGQPHLAAATSPAGA